MTSARVRPLIALDLLRLFCAAGVVAYHLLAANIRSPSAHARAALAGSPLPSGGVGWAWWGWIGVELFFIISGYVIARSAEGATPLAFLRRRALRLFPAAWLCASISLAVMLATGPERLDRLAAGWIVSALLLPMGTPIDGSYWTLSVEIAFYLLVAAWLGAAGSARGIERLGVGLGLASLFFWTCGTTDWANGALHLLALLAMYGVDFALGIAIASMHRHRKSGIARLGWLALMAAATLLAVAAHAAERAAGLGVDAGPLTPALLVAGGVGVLIAAPTWQARLERSWIAPHASTLGLMTYPLYLVHQDAGAALIAALMRVGFPYFTGAALAALFATGCAWLVACRWETGLRTWLAERLITRPRALAEGNRRIASPPAD